MPPLQMGLGLFPTQPPLELLETVKLAERLGYSHIWLGDSQVIWREVYVNLGAAAVTTERVILGAGVTNPITRDITVTASALAALSELTGGRVALGIGAGDSSLETIGRRPATLAQLEQSIAAVRRLLAGELVTMGAGEVQMDWARVAPVPVFIGASGPRILRLAGKIADGVIMLAGTDPEYLRQAMECVRRGATEAGRDLDSEGFQYVCWTPCSISADGVSARASVKAHVARVLKRPLPFELSEDDRAVVERVYKSYDYHQHMVVGAGHSDPIPDCLVGKFAIAGTVDECREQVRAMAAASIHQVAIVPHTEDPRDRSSIVRSFAKDVMSAA